MKFELKSKTTILETDTSNIQENTTIIKKKYKIESKLDIPLIFKPNTMIINVVNKAEIQQNKVKSISNTICNLDEKILTNKKVQTQTKAEIIDLT